MWKILGIEPTRNETAIQEAYRKKLPSHHPEEDPEGFRALREAYEAALKSLRDEARPEDDSPSGRIVKAFAEVYRDFRRRIDPAAWREILNLDICARIDMQYEIGEKLLAFLMNAHHLPQEVWRLLNDFFCWNEQRELLREKIPTDFLNYVRDSIRYEELLRCALFSVDSSADSSAGDETQIPGASTPDYDEFINLYLAINGAINAGDQEKAAALFSQADGMGINHPDYTLLKLRNHVVCGRNAEAAAMADALMADFPDDVRVIHGAAQAYLRARGAGEATPLFEAVLQREPNHYGARVGLVACYIETERCESAKDICRELLQDHLYDAYVRSLFATVNDRLIPLYEARLKADANDLSAVYKLAACYCNMEKYAECRDLLRDVVPDEAHLARHHDLCACALMHTSEQEAAFEHLLLWERLETDRVRVAQELPYFLLALDRQDEALERSLRYLEDFPNEAALYAVKASVLRERGQLREALEAAEAGLAADGGYLNLHWQRAEICYALNLHGDALDSASEALNIYPLFADMLLIKVRVYFDAEDYEEALSICERATRDAIADPRFDPYRAAARIWLRRDLEEAGAALEICLRTDPTNPIALPALCSYYEERGRYDDLSALLDVAVRAEPDALRLRLMRLKAYRLLKEPDRVLEEALWVEQNLTAENADLQVELGLAYREKDDLDHAEQHLLSAIRYDEYHFRAYAELADICLRSNRVREAIDYYTEQLRVREHPYYCLCRGYAHSRLGGDDHAAERADYTRALELEPEYDLAHNNLGILCYEEDAFAEARQHLEKACELNRDLASARQYLAKALYKLGEVDLAVQTLREGIDWFTDRDEGAIPRFYRELAVLYCDEGNNDEAMAIRETVLNFFPFDAELLCKFGDCAYELGENRTAETHYERALREDAKNASAWRGLARLHAQTFKRYRKAVRFYKEALACEPENPSTMIYIAQTLTLLGRKREAENNYRNALRLLLAEQAAGSSRPPCLNNLFGECYLGLGDFAQAEAHCRVSMEEAASYTRCSDRYCHESVFCLAKIHEARGELDEAERRYNEVVDRASSRRYVIARDEFLKKHKRKGSIL